jgi:zinc transport system ATP-binding protein
MPNILEVKKASVVLNGETIVRGVSFDLAEGESLAIIGPNGAGTTVFLRALLGMVPHDGEIIWHTKTKIGYVPQKIDADRHLPVNFKNLLAAKAQVIGARPHELTEIVKEVGLDERIMRTPVGHLSGGQFQRALIAFALLGKPNVLIFDEPTASIDKPGEERMYELVHRLQDDYGITAILVSHDLSFVYRYAIKVLAINKNEICFGPPEEVLTPQALEKLYGGPMKFYHAAHEHHHDTSL